jgi:cardiolipin synthase A/B
LKSIAAVIYVLAIAVTLVHILFNKRDARAAVLWLILVTVSPVIGFAVYWLLGNSRTKEFFRRAHHLQLSDLQKVSNRSGLGLNPLRWLGDAVTGHHLKSGNSVRPLFNGYQAYPVMLKAIERARHSVALATYIFDSDEVGNEFAKALADAAVRGVQVRVLVDGPAFLALRYGLRKVLKVSGVRLAGFWTQGQWFSSPMLNLRNHRKLLIVDGQTGFTGGMNISERYLKGAIQSVKKLGRRGLGRPEPKARDVHFLMRGPVVADLMEVFASDWLHVTSETLAGRSWFPKLKARGREKARGVVSGPDQLIGRSLELLLGALRAAKRQVDLCTPYFIPDRAMLAALRAASYSGVRVRLFVPRDSDQSFVSWASRAYYADLLEAGVEIWELGGGFVHTKVTIVDQQWCIIGSSNLDPRSFHLNFEFNVEVYSRTLARTLERLLNGYLHDATRITPAVLKRESFFIKLRNLTAKLASPYL